ncbi:MAG: helix-turn-helix transcriptional regulator [Paracoccaceae bacterium]
MTEAAEEYATADGKANRATPPVGSSGRAQGRSIILAICLMIQATAAVFFVGDVIEDMLEAPPTIHVAVEALVTVALVLGVIFGGWALARTLDMMRAQENALRVASGALVDVIEAQFAAWSLTPAEREVGLLALKGFDVAEIAEYRKAASGTVRAQLARIYAKAGVSGRAQLTAYFVEDLLGGPILPPPPGARPQSGDDEDPAVEIEVDAARKDPLA